MNYKLNKYSEKSLGSKFFSKLSKLNFLIIASVILLGFVGVASLYSAAGGYWDPWAQNHLIRLIFGIFLMLILAFLPHDIFFKLSVLSFIIGILSLILVKFIGTGNVQRWITLGGINFQPSEAMKLALILILARYFDHISRIELYKFKTYVLPICLILLPGFLVISQPDLGTGLTIILLGLAILFFVGISIKFVILCFILLASSIPFIWNQLYDYQKDRILVFLNPEIDSLGSGYQIIQSKIAIGSGGFFGKGYLLGSQSRLNYLPEKHTDFIFTLFSEEFGFVGSMILLIIYAIIIIRIISIGLISRSFFSRLFCYSFAFAIFLYVTINMSMVLGLLPIVGSPLPIMSYGGSSLLATMIGFSIVLSAKINHNQNIS